MTQEIDIAALRRAIEEAEHKPGEWATTVTQMGGICTKGTALLSMPPKEDVWASFSYKRDSWLAVGAVNALPALLDRLEQAESALHSYRIALASEFPLDADGEPDVGNVHANVRALNVRLEQAEKDAARYRWLRDDHAYWPEEHYVRGGDELDELIDGEMRGGDE